MANKKRKTLQIKRPDPSSAKAKKKPLPKVNVDEKAATSSVDTDELVGMGPRTAKMKRPEDQGEGGKGNTTRIALPDEEKIRRARRANATQDLDEQGALPSADQIEQAQNSATMPIMIDTENVEDNAGQRLPSGDTGDSIDQTMEIDADALSTGNLEHELEEADQGAKQADEQGDQTMRIDPEALSTGNLEQDLSDAEQSNDNGDQTMRIDPDALATRNLEAELEEGEDEESDQTMQIDPESLKTGAVDPLNVQDMETMKMETMKMEEDLDEDGETDLTKEELEDSFNAQTMEMDADKLSEELKKPEKKPAEEKDAGATLDMSKQQRPKTILIKRPSRQQAGPNAPTVKAARPGADDSKAVPANRSEPKEGTSRIDLPGGDAGGDATEGTTKEGKTIKLRRPSGAPQTSSRASSVTNRSGLSMNEDGSATSLRPEKNQLGGGWLAVAVLTFLVSLGALWTVMALSQPELPMPGRLVDVNGQLIEPLP